MSKEDPNAPVKRIFRIKAQHTVCVIYEVEAVDFDAALSTISDIELFQVHGDNLAGPSDYIMEHYGITVSDFDVYSDPSPTGHKWVKQDWEYEDFADKEEASENCDLTAW